MNTINKFFFAYMQKVTVAVLCIVFFMASGCGKQNSVSDEDETDFYYGAGGEKQYFTIRKDKVILKCELEADANALANRDIFLSANVTGEHWIFGSIDPPKTKLNDLLQIPEVVSATYGLGYSNGSVYYPIDRIAVQLTHGHTMEELFDATGLTNSVDSIELFSPHSELYVITLNVDLGDILPISRRLYETGWCVVAAPSMIWELKVH